MKSTVLSIIRGLLGVCALLLLSIPFWSSFAPTQSAVYAEAQQPAALGSISGVVRNSAGEPLGGMQLTLYYSMFYDSNWQAMMVTTSDSSGRYRFSALPANTYRIGIVDPTAQYGKNFYTEQNTIWGATDLVVNGVARAGVDLTLAAGGVITGVLRAANGVSFLDQLTYLYQKVDPLYFSNGQSTEWLQIETSYQPDTRNHFTFRGLASGVYRVCASSYAPGGYWQECYDDVYRVTNAQSFTVTAGTVISNIEIVLGDGADLGMISGRITSAQDGPVADIGVYVVPADAVSLSLTPTPLATPTAAPLTSSAAHGTNEQADATPTALPPANIPNLPYRYYTSTAADGTYTVTNVFDGNYQLYFHDRRGRYRAEYYNDVTYRSNAAAVVVAQQRPVMGINAELALGAHLTGTITLFGQPAPPTTLYLHKQENNQWFIAATTTSDPLTGNYAIGGLPAGTYRLQAAVTLNYSPQTAYALYGFYGGAEWSTAATIQLATAETRPGVDINIAQGPRFDGAVRGRVTAGGAPVAGVKVSLYPLSCCHSLWLGNAFTFATTDQDGRYRINGLSDGIYHVRYEDPTGAFASLFYPNQPLVDSTHYVITNDAEATVADVELPPAGSVKGQVRSLTAADLADLTMVAVISTAEQNTFIYREAPLQADGSFVLAGLYPGRYYICAAIKIGANQGYNNFDCYGSFRELPWYIDGVPVTVAAGQITEQIDLLWGPDHKQYLPVIAR